MVMYSSRLLLLWTLASLFSLPTLFLVHLRTSRLIPYVRQAVTFSVPVRRHFWLRVFVMLIW